MKRSNPFTPLFVAAGLSLITLPVFAQSTAGSASAGTATDRPSTSGSTVTPGSSTRTGSSSTTSPNMPEARTHSSMDSSTNPSTPGVDSSRPTPNVDANSGNPVTGLSGNPVTGLSGNPITGLSTFGFDQLDSDHDGRVSQVEYTQSALLDAGRVSTQGSATMQSNTSGTTGASTTNGGARSSTGVHQGSSQIVPAETFQQIDRNHDGYLTRDELRAAQGNGSGSTQR